MKKSCLIVLFLVALKLDSQTGLIRAFPQAPPVSGFYSECEIKKPVKTSDGGYIFSFFPWSPNLHGYGPWDCYTIKTDSNFVPQWKKPLFIQSIPLASGSILLIYKTWFYSSGFGEGTVIEKITPSGAQTWIKKLSNVGFEDLAISDGVAYNNKIRLVGRKQLAFPWGGSYSWPYTIEMDTLGNILSQALFNTSNGANADFSRIKRDSLGNFFVYNTWDPDFLTNMVFAKFDSSFSFVWAKTSSQALYFEDIDFLPGGNILIAGMSYFPFNAILLKTNSSGNILTQSLFKNGGRVKGLCKTGNNSFVAATSLLWQDSLCLFETDTAMNITWAKFYSKGVAMGTSVIKNNLLCTPAFIASTPHIMTADLSGNSCRSVSAPYSLSTPTFSFSNMILTPTVSSAALNNYTLDSIFSQSYVDSCACQPTKPPINLNLCSGVTVTLSANGMANPYWYGSLTSGTPVASGPNLTMSFASPTVTTFYLEDSLCIQSQARTQMILNVSQTPSIVISAAQSTICNGGSVNLTAQGATTYTWNNALNGGTIVVTPTANIVYSVTGTAQNNCVSGNTIHLTVLSNPVISLISSASVICAGLPVSLSAIGALSYSWSTGNISSGINMAPTATTAYSVVGTSANQCTAAAVYTVAVNPLPVVTAAATNPSVCPGFPAYLTANGALTYSWSTGASVIASGIYVVPMVNTIYTVTGTNANSCSNTATVSVDVFMPMLNIISTDSVICAGQSVTLTVLGPNTYSWNVALNTPSIAVSPTITSVYTAYGIDNNGCDAVASHTQVVNICTGNALNGLNPEIIDLFPNPTTAMFTLRYSNAADPNSNIGLYNALGQLLLEQTITKENTIISLQHHASGVYYLHVKGTTTGRVFKVVKQ